METEPCAQDNAPVALLNREGPYVIIALFGMSILGCASVLVYSFNNYAKLKRNVEELRSYISDSHARVAEQQSEDSIESGAVDTGSTVKSAPVTPVAVAGNQLSVDMDAQTRSDASVGHGSSDTSDFMAREEPSSADPATVALSVLTSNSTNATGDSFAGGH